MKPRFLVSRLSSLGDVVCTLPVAGALKAGFPESEIVWVVDPRFAGIVRRCRHVDRVEVPGAGLEMVKHPLLKLHYEAALDLQGLFKSSLFVALARAERKLGYHWQREGAWLFSQRVLPDPTSLHIVDQYVDVARAAGGVADAADFGLEPHEDDVARVREKLREKGVENGFVAINACAGWATKRWPAESYAEVVDGLSDLGAQAVLIGTRSPADVCAAQGVIERASRPPAIMLGETTPELLVALLSLCRAHVGGDTGSTHLAAALGKPAIGLYSITQPQRVCPYGQIDRCLYDPEGIDRIAPSQVLEKLAQALQ